MTKTQKMMVLPALALAILGGGALAGYTSFASAQAPDTATATQNASAQGAHDFSKGGHVGSNGVKEELLTGDTAAKVSAAALAEVPGATVERVETDAEGAVYEAHMTKSDGSHVTVKFDAHFNVTGTEDGPMHR